MSLRQARHAQTQNFRSLKDEDDLPPRAKTTAWMAGYETDDSDCDSEILGDTDGGRPTVHDKDGPDLVFLGHPAYLVDMFSLFSTPSPDHRWTASCWMYIFFPFVWLIGFFLAHLRRRLCCSSHLVVDEVVYNGIRMQTWVVHHFGRNFRNNCQRHDSRKNVEIAAQAAERAGCRVLGLGALNKAEFLNHGGKDLLDKLPEDRSMAITHGNHLTAAAVVETVRQLVEAGHAKGKVPYITGATSKTGRAVALSLRKHYGIQLMCHSSSPERREDLEKHGLLTTDKFEDGHDSPLWIIGKYDLRVCDHIPKNGVACVFAVPDPFAISGKRPDVTNLEGATLHIDESRLDRPRKFTNLLKTNEIYACHAGSILRACSPELGTKDELGDIDPDSLPSYIARAKAVGITVPPPPPIPLAEDESDASTSESDDEESKCC
eukprot:gb/GFBE01002611.1/.p1 GENE.gb/GFBE01002611.1/~~gb/GFBE01002611.1/.p1  ORF type:complete len:433 (+),score=79.11 gb/GFBE01002611.1/:1-1299(+)